MRTTQLAYIKNKDGTTDLAHILTRESNGNFYIFKYPLRSFAQDSGRSVKSVYVKTIIVNKLYLKIAKWFVIRFPNWVTL